MAPLRHTASLTAVTVNSAASQIRGRYLSCSSALSSHFHDSRLADVIGDKTSMEISS